MNEAKCRAIVKARSSGICEICGEARGEQCHHRLNRSQMGKWTPANILHLCVLCHSRVGESPRTASRLGHTVWSYEDPARKKVMLWTHGVRRWVLLDDEGGINTDLQEAV